MAIVRVALPVAADKLFDYWSPSGLEIQRGSVLRVRLGRRRLLGIAVDRVEATDIAPERVAPVDEIVTALPPLPADLCELARFVSEYYQQPIGQCFAQLLPPLGSTARARTPLADRYRLTAGRHAALARHADTRSLLRLPSVLSAPAGATARAGNQPDAATRAAHRQRAAGRQLGRGPQRTFICSAAFPLARCSAG